MKKLLFICLLAGLMSPACEKEKKAPVEVGEFNVEHVIAVDRQDMFMNYGETYRWYETCILLKEYLDSNEASNEITGISNVFQVYRVEDECIDTDVVMYTHTADTAIVDVKHGFWVDDFPLNEELIKVTFEEAYQKVMEVNYEKPHSRQCVIRKPIGPINCNPQYIFGNIHSQIYVDATNGNVTDKNPAFNE